MRPYEIMPKKIVSYVDHYEASLCELIQLILVFVSRTCDNYLCRIMDFFLTKKPFSVSISTLAAIKYLRTNYSLMFEARRIWQHRMLLHFTISNRIRANEFKWIIANSSRGSVQIPIGFIWDSHAAHTIWLEIETIGISWFNSVF